MMDTNLNRNQLIIKSNVLLFDSFASIFLSLKYFLNPVYTTPSKQ